MFSMIFFRISLTTSFQAVANDMQFDNFNLIVDKQSKSANCLIETGIGFFYNSVLETIAQIDFSK